MKIKETKEKIFLWNYSFYFILLLQTSKLSFQCFISRYLTTFRFLFSLHFTSYSFYTFILNFTLTCFSLFFEFESFNSHLCDQLKVCYALRRMPQIDRKIRFFKSYNRAEIFLLREIKVSNWNSNFNRISPSNFCLEIFQLKI